MMRFLIVFVFSMVLSAIAAYFGPWWMIGLVPFVLSFLLRLWPGRGFLAGFSAIFLLWGAYALKADTANEHVLSTRMAPLFGLPHYGLFLLVTALLGGIVGGLGGWSGAQLSAFFRRPLPKAHDNSLLPLREREINAAEKRSGVKYN